MVKRSESGTSLDPVDQRLVELLMDEGRMTNRALAQEVGLTDATVAVHVRRLIEEGIVSVGPQFDWHMAGYRSEAIVYVRVSGRGPRSVAETLARLPGAQHVGIICGDADVVVLLLAPDAHAMHRVLGRFTDVPGVASVETNYIIEMHEFKVGRGALPYQPTLIEDLPNPSIKLDRLDVSIIDLLRGDGRLSSREIARQISVSDATIRSRVRRMTDAGLLRIGALVNPWAIDQVSASAQVGLVVRGDAVDKVIAALVRHPAVGICASSIGRHNIVAAIATRTQEQLLRITSETLWALKGVESVQTWPILENVSQRSDLVRLFPKTSSS